MGQEGGKGHESSRLKSGSEDEPAHLPAMDVKKPSTALPGRLGGWSGDGGEDIAVL